MTNYQPTLADRLLGMIRENIPSAEFRHESMAPLARAMQFFAPWQAPRSAKRRIEFADGSTSLALRSPLMLAAGAAKQARYLSAFASFGFGAVSVGTATLRARRGNPLHPRVRTVEEFRAIQNAMGLNNPGIESLVRRIAAQRYDIENEGLLVGISVAEDPDLFPDESPDGNVLACLAAAWPEADYIELNLSCPNTGHERLDRAWDRIRRLLGKSSEFRDRQNTKKPFWVKLSPDLSPEVFAMALETVREAGLTGVILFNTWPAAHGTWPDGTPLAELPELGRPGLLGGLSGHPLFGRTLDGIRQAKDLSTGLSLIGCGGIETGSEASDLLDAGAELVQLYSVLAFRWLAARRINEELRS
jgi:dihydroorotate dehydrogenase